MSSRGVMAGGNEAFLGMLHPPNFLIDPDEGTACLFYLKFPTIHSLEVTAFFLKFIIPLNSIFLFTQEN